MNSESDQKSSISRINEMIRTTSVLRMENICQRSGFSISESSDQKIVKDHWMAQVLVSGSQIRITFRVFYNFPTLSDWARATFESQSEAISSNQIHDLAKEYCNLIAGQIKYSLGKNQVKVGMSLPFLSRGFDQVFLSLKKTDQIYMDSWKILLGESFVTCSSNIEVFKDFSFSSKDNETDGGKIEFL